MGGSVDHAVAGLLDGGGLLLLVPLAFALGLRHATDLDHLVAVGALVGGDGGDVRGAARLGAWWGVGHAAALLLVGIPVVMAGTAPPGWLGAPVERLVGVTIVLLTVRALRHHHRASAPRSAPAAAAVGVLHGVGGTGAIVLLVLARLDDPGRAVVALLAFAPATALSMATCSGAMGWALARRGPVIGRGHAPRVAAAAGVAFGAWYALTA